MLVEVQSNLREMGKFSREVADECECGGPTEWDERLKNENLKGRRVQER